jgi:hypothetical protein
VRIALVAPPFIPIPPVQYGGTELFIADLANGLHALGADVIVYTNGEATIGVETKWLFTENQRRREMRLPPFQLGIRPRKMILRAQHCDDAES